MKEFNWATSSVLNGTGGYLLVFLAEQYLQQLWYAHVYLSNIEKQLDAENIEKDRL